MASTVPNVFFKTRVRDESLGGDNPFRWQDVSTDDVFKGKKIVIFCLPGAFTPTCSSTMYRVTMQNIRKLSIRASMKFIV